MKYLKYIIVLAAAVILSAGACLAQETEEKEGGVDASGIILGHVKDSYEWHFWGSGEKTVAIYLPVIVHSKTTGWHCFSSRKVAEGETYEGFYIAPEGTRHEGKIVELNAAGEEVRPFDISITKTVLGLMINSLVVLIIVLCTARWYRRNDCLEKAPRGIAALIEPVIIFINDEVIKDAVGPEYEKFTPYLLTVFFFILGNNLMGIIPFFPGGANVTGNIAITFTLAICTFLCVNLTTNKHYWKDIFWPDTPWWLKVPLPLMPTVEIIGMFTKPFALMVRLFANILAGHSMILSIVCVVFLTHTMGAALNGTLSAVSVFFGVFVDLIEVLVAFLQAYVFTMLSAVFIGLSHPHPEHELSTEN
ncbi:MAG: F0F1 ATP synthase subunit A [Bacteroidales bacterium]|nr:F0F1 ATP synthase subunit A [Bacteroidales bacterium]